MWRPSGESTQGRCASLNAGGSPSTVPGQSRIVPSLFAVATQRLSGEHAASLYPPSTGKENASSRVVASQKHKTLLAKPPVITHRPSGENLTRPIASPCVLLRSQVVCS